MSPSIIRCGSPVGYELITRAENLANFPEIGRTCRAAMCGEIRRAGRASTEHVNPAPPARGDDRLRIIPAFPDRHVRPNFGKIRQIFGTGDQVRTQPGLPHRNYAGRHSGQYRHIACADGGDDYFPAHWAIFALTSSIGTPSPRSNFVQALLDSLAKLQFINGVTDVASGGSFLATSRRISLALMVSICTQSCTISIQYRRIANNFHERRKGGHGSAIPQRERVGFGATLAETASRTENISVKFLGDGGKPRAPGFEDFDIKESGSSFHRAKLAQGDKYAGSRDHAGSRDQNDKPRPVG